MTAHRKRGAAVAPVTWRALGFVWVVFTLVGLYWLGEAAALQAPGAWRCWLFVALCALNATGCWVRASLAARARANRSGINRTDGTGSARREQRAKHPV